MLLSWVISYVHSRQCIHFLQRYNFLPRCTQDEYVDWNVLFLYLGFLIKLPGNYECMTSVNVFVFNWGQYMSTSVYMWKEVMV